MSEIIRDEKRVDFSFSIGRYTITPCHEKWMWLTNESGEGMQIWNEELERMLGKYFADNF